MLDYMRAVAALIVVYLLALGTAIAALGTHIVICIQSGAWGILIAGAILPPVGIVHGIGHWFGCW